MLLSNEVLDDAATVGSGRAHFLRPSYEALTQTLVAPSALE